MQGRKVILWLAITLVMLIGISRGIHWERGESFDGVHEIGVGLDVAFEHVLPIGTALRRVRDIPLDSSLGRSAVVAIPFRR